MTRKSELRGKLESIKELKAEYLLSSYDAYHYLKARKALEAIQEAILDDQSDIGAADPQSYVTIPLIEWVIITLAKFLSHYLENLSNEISTPEQYSIGAQHIIIPSIDLEPFAIRYREQLDANPNSHPNTWTLECTQFIPGFFSKLNLIIALSHSQDKVIPQTLNEFLFGFRERWEKNSFTLHFRRTNNEVNFSEFCRENTYRRPMLHPWNEADLILEDEDGSALFPADRDLLRQARMAEDLQLAHPLLLKSVHQTEDEFWHSFYKHTIWPEQNKKGIDQWLYRDSWRNNDNDTLYKRACRELTLKHTHIERRILLCDVHEKQSSDTEPEELWEAAVEWHEDNIVLKKNHLEYLRAHCAPDMICEGTQDDITYSQYLLTALHNNHRWLVDFLSH